MSVPALAATAQSGRCPTASGATSRDRARSYRPGWGDPGPRIVP